MPSCSGSAPWRRTSSGSRASTGDRATCIPPWSTSPSASPSSSAVLHSVGLYRRLWRFAGVAELEHILVATAISASLSSLVGAAILPGTGITPHPGAAVGAVHRRLPQRRRRGAAAAHHPAPRPPHPVAKAGDRPPGAHRRRRRRGRDDREGAAGPSAARPRSHRLRGRRPHQARPPALRPPGARLARPDPGPGASVRRRGGHHRHAAGDRARWSARWCGPRWRPG